MTDANTDIQAMSRSELVDTIEKLNKELEEKSALLATFGCHGFGICAECEQPYDGSCDGWRFHNKHGECSVCCQCEEEEEPKPKFKIKRRLVNTINARAAKRKILRYENRYECIFCKKIDCWDDPDCLDCGKKACVYLKQIPIYREPEDECRCEGTGRCTCKCDMCDDCDPPSD
jgi:hypothetical protein